MDFSIESIHRHRNGFCVATILSYKDQGHYVVHDRYGSWMIGDPEAKASPMRETAVISVYLASDLQARVRSLGDKIPVQERSTNIFVERAREKKPVNPFIAKAAKTNPMIARLLAKGKIG